MTAQTAVRKRQFNTLFFVEMWERFAFYGFQALFMLFITYEKLPHKQAYMIYGIFQALLWGAPVIGGILADRLIGIKRSLVLGGIVFAGGYGLLTLSASIGMVIAALSLIALGNGFFKAAPSSLLSRIFADDSTAAKKAFAYFYMAINIGGMVSMFTLPLIALHYSYRAAFLLTVLGMLIGLGNFLWQRRLFHGIASEADGRPLTPTRLFSIAAILVALFAVFDVLLHFLNVSFYLLLLAGLGVLIYLLIARTAVAGRVDRFKFSVGIILLVECVAFWTIYNQLFSTIILFAQHNADLTLFGFRISAANVTLLDPLCIIALTPVLAKIYQTLKNKRVGLTIPFKFSIGLCCSGLSVLLLALAAALFAHDGTLNLGWTLPAFISFAIGELLISALGLSMVALYFPEKMKTFYYGTFFLTSAIGGALTGKLAALFVALPKHVSPEQSLPIYIHYFAWLGLVTIVIAALYLVIAFVIRRCARQSAVTID